MFEFEVWYVFGRKYIAVDGLSQRPSTVADIDETEFEKDIDDFILTELNSFQVSPISLDDATHILANKYSDDSRKNATYLTTLRRPPELDT